MLQVSETNRRFQLQMPAMLCAIEDADDRVCAWLADKGLSIDLFATRLILHEALLNAVTHGSHENPELSVSLNIELGDTGMVITVEDAGPGFSRSHLPPMNTLGSSGRGLSLMETYSSAMHFNERGNRITLYRSYEVSQETTVETADTRRA